eukprot:6156302-Pleurochrysis_carterae.AAC.2
MEQSAEEHVLHAELNALHAELALASCLFLYSHMFVDCLLKLYYDPRIPTGPDCSAADTKNLERRESLCRPVERACVRARTHARTQRGGRGRKRERARTSSSALASKICSVSLALSASASRCAAAVRRRRASASAEAAAAVVEVAEEGMGDVATGSAAMDAGGERSESAGCAGVLVEDESVWLVWAVLGVAGFAIGELHAAVPAAFAKALGSACAGAVDSLPRWLPLRSRASSCREGAACTRC